MKKIEVLDKGFVELVANMGDDSSIASAARVSYQKGTKSIRDDESLIDYLVRHEHTSPLEMVEFVFHIKLPLFVMGQLVRHRTASLNQVSARYSVMEDEFYIPDSLRGQDSINKQGSVDKDFEDESYLLEGIIENSATAYELYENLLGKGVARELARINLPQNLYTQVIWKQDLKNLLHLLKLRMDSHAQFEIREYANAIFELIKPLVPSTINSWENHVLNAVKFSKDELEYLRDYINDSNTEIKLSKSRRLELSKKLERVKNG